MRHILDGGQLGERVVNVVNDHIHLMCIEVHEFI